MDHSAVLSCAFLCIYLDMRLGLFLEERSLVAEMLGHRVRAF